jgi:hypothetical protein
MIDFLPALMLSSAVAAAIPAAAMTPLKLEVSTSGGASVIRIIGESPVACSASYQLEVRDAQHGNRSVTGGNATLTPGIRQTVATVALGAGSAGTTVATLDVKPCGGKPYQQAWSATTP